jgi:hypothetical protein
MLQWIKETFFPDDQTEQLLEANARLQREIEAHKAAYASEIGFYHREIKRLSGEMAQLLKGMEVTG